MASGISSGWGGVVGRQAAVAPTIEFSSFEPTKGQRQPEYAALGVIGAVRGIARLPVSFVVSYMLIHARASQAFTGQRHVLSRPADWYGQPWTAILNAEKRKVGGSTRPLTTTLTSGNAVMIKLSPQAC
jgi:hypothetical protein